MAFRFLCMACLALPLFACAKPKPEPAIYPEMPTLPPKPAKPVVSERKPQPEAYIANLTLARLALNPAAPRPDEAAAPLDALKTFHSKTPLPAKAYPILVIDYKPKAEKETKRIIAPIDHQAASGDYHSIYAIFKKLNTQPHALQDLHLSTVVVEIPQKPLKLMELKQEDISHALDLQQRKLLETAAAMPPLESVPVQLPLIRFFIRHRLQDAAYLMVDNAKRSLAQATRALPQERTTIQAWLQQIEELESELHRSMPYRL